MAGTPQTAIPVPIADVQAAFVGYKIRTAGTILSYDQTRAQAILSSQRHNLILDCTLILDEEMSAALLQPGQTVLAIGTVELANGDNTTAIELHCIHLEDAKGLDLTLWEEAARRISMAMHAEPAR